MPEVRHYVVTQTLTVGVNANSPADAVRVASEAFNNGQQGTKLLSPVDGVWGNTTDRVRITKTDAVEL